MLTLIDNIGELVTLAPLAEAPVGTRIRAAHLGCLANAWIAIDNGKVKDFGTGAPPRASWSHQFDARGGLLLPGLVDCHTHLIFAGSRAHEFGQRLEGATYQAIAAAGGGIAATMRATRAAKDEDLLANVKNRLWRMLQLGVTSVEVKSGYGLSPREELRLLRLLKEARASAVQELTVTCLALHSASPEFASRQAYAQACQQELLPVLRAEGLASFVDVFIESGYFVAPEVEGFVTQAKAQGLGVRVHADEFTSSGGAQAAAEWGAASADHLQCADARGLHAMANAGVTGVLLPGTSLYSRLPFTDGRRLVDAGLSVAIATDFNPGSCQLDNLAQMASVAAVQCGLTKAESLAGVTAVAARSLGTKKGILAPGWAADAVLYDLPDSDAWIADFGRTPPRTVLVGGRPVVGL